MSAAASVPSYRYPLQQLNKHTVALAVELQRKPSERLGFIAFIALARRSPSAEGPLVQWLSLWVTEGIC